eukprot:scaffold23567_cov48-Phaeocystis_antarctica.AAC.2
MQCRAVAIVPSARRLIRPLLPHGDAVLLAGVVRLVVAPVEVRGRGCAACPDERVLLRGVGQADPCPSIPVVGRPGAGVLLRMQQEQHFRVVFGPVDGRELAASCLAVLLGGVP